MMSFNVGLGPGRSDIANDWSKIVKRELKMGPALKCKYCNSVVQRRF